MKHNQGYNNLIHGGQGSSGEIAGILALQRNIKQQLKFLKCSVQASQAETCPALGGPAKGLAGHQTKARRTRRGKFRLAIPSMLCSTLAPIQPDFGPHGIWYFPLPVYVASLLPYPGQIIKMKF